MNGSGNDAVILVLHVDDLLIVGHQLSAVKAVKKCLSNEFEMTDVGEVQTFLEMKMSTCLWINQ